MTKKLILSLLSIATALHSKGQETNVGIPQTFPDSAIISVHASYNKGNAIHRKLFGENYRKEWAAKVKLPIINIKDIQGGLSPLKLGGGFETKSVRLEDKTGKEWVIRSVEKVPDKLVPVNLRGTFVLDWLDDEYSGQHPYSALIVPPLAEAARVPHAHPVIGILAPDPSLQAFGRTYAGRVVLLEEREPTGKSDNTLKMLKELVSSNKNRFDKEEFLRARMLDVLIGDWDRHEDQWRWFPEKKGKEKIYTAVPRDRDQVMHVNEGIFPTLSELPWLDPQIGNFNEASPKAKYSPLYKSRFIQQYPDFQFSYDEWMRVVNEFVKAESNEVLEAAMNCMPKGLDKIRNKDLLAKLKKRRDDIPAIMSEYYHFIYRIVDIRTSDEDEQVVIDDAPQGGLRVIIARVNKSGSTKENIMDVTYQPDITQQIRLYVEGGDDHVIFNNGSSVIKLKVIGTSGRKDYEAKTDGKKIQIYGRKDSVQVAGNTSRLRTHLSDDTSNTHFVSANPYNIWIPQANGSLNKDDGFLLGLGFKYIGKDGFRKLPYSTVQELMLTHSFETKAFRINYEGQWIQAIGKADFTINALVDAPNNTMNFFGQGNNTILDKSGNDYLEHYRTRFDYYELDPALRWHTGVGSTISAGPAFQYYNFDKGGNADRSVTQPGLIHSYDSSSYSENRAHIGIIVDYKTNRKDNQLLPTKGFYFDANLQAYTGLNGNSKSFLQVRPEFTYFQKIDTGAHLVLSDRIGGGVSIGNPAFYQEMFLGGQGNLLGYLQNRFSGKQMAYNDFQARWKIANIGGYILPGQLGVTGFYDIGRVWIDGESSSTWHYGTGGGIYFAPASLTVIQIIAGHSKEGWYPYIAFNFRL